MFNNKNHYFIIVIFITILIMIFNILLNSFLYDNSYYTTSRLIVKTSKTYQIIMR